MPFDYYYDLSPEAQRAYRASDAYGAIELSNPSQLQPLVPDIEKALEIESAEAVEVACQRLISAICDDLNVSYAQVIVEERRPSDATGELHGLYDWEDEEYEPVITVWMRSAKRGQVVALKTFLRTLLHELCHHLDYELLELEDTWHTEGFFMRESSLFKQLMDKPQMELWP